MGIVPAILAVFSEVGEWIVSQLSDVQSLFWVVGEAGDPAQLTFLGTVSLISLGVGLACMLIGLVTNFLKFRS